MATVVDYTHFTAMLAPRAALLTYNFKDDCCFASPHALPPLLAAAEPIFKLYGKEKNLRSHVNHDPGTHNFERDNREQFYKMIGDFFYPGDTKFSATEIPCADEIKTDVQLYVPLPANNGTFNTLALALSKDLPRNVHIHSYPPAFNRWQRNQRKELQTIVRAPVYSVRVAELESEEKDGLKAVFCKFTLGKERTVPVVEFSRGETKGTTVLIGDTGRKNLAADVERLAAAGQRVLVVDLFYFGEAKVASRYPLFVDTVGERPLGIQAAQLNAIAGWVKTERAKEPVSVATVGPRSSLIALVAAGLDAKKISGLELKGSLTSLKELIEKNRPVNEMPEMFCFGLLEAFDVPQLEALASPRPIVKR
jgi:hypothetical protein